MKDCKKYKAVSKHPAVSDISCFWWSGDPRFEYPVFTPWVQCRTLTH